MNEIEILELNMSRYDSYIEKADNKANFILALTSVILVGLVFQSNDILNIITNDMLKRISIFILIGISILLIISSCLALNVILPSIKESTVKSIFYFKDVASYTEEEYKRIMKEFDDNKILADFRRQVIQLGSICTIKMNKVRSSLKFLLVAGVFIVIQLFIIFTSLY